MNKNIEWPDELPKRLRDVMWKFEGICGIYSYWNKYCDYSSRGSGLFLKSVFEDFFSKNKINPNTVKDLTDFVVKSFTVYYDADQQVFKVSIKKNKETEKREVDAKRLKEVADGLGFDGKQCKAMIKMMLENAVGLYNEILKNGEK